MHFFVSGFRIHNKLTLRDLDIMMVYKRAAERVYRVFRWRIMPCDSNFVSSLVLVCMLGAKVTPKLFYDVLLGLLYLILCSIRLVTNRWRQASSNTIMTTWKKSQSWAHLSARSISINTTKKSWTMRISTKLILEIPTRYWRKRDKDRPLWEVHWQSVYKI